MDDDEYCMDVVCNFRILGREKKGNLLFGWINGMEGEIGSHRKKICAK